MQVTVFHLSREENVKMNPVAYHRRAEDAVDIKSFFSGFKTKQIYCYDTSWYLWWF